MITAFCISGCDLSDAVRPVHESDHEDMPHALLDGNMENASEHNLEELDDDFFSIRTGSELLSQLYIPSFSRLQSWFNSI
jgi:hypothetical protein